MKKKDLRCIHRHTIKEHPKCFSKGLVKWENDRQFERSTGKAWYTYPEYRIGYIDLEVDNLNADFGHLLTWCIKEKDGPVYFDYIIKEDLFNGLGDINVVKSLVDKMREFKILVSYYGTNFDIPFARARALYNGLDFPEYGEIFHFDLYYTVKSKLKLSRNSLDNVCNFLSIDGKTPIDKNVWRKARFGDPEAIKEVLSHNVGDVDITEQLHNKLEFTKKWIRRSI